MGLAGSAYDRGNILAIERKIFQDANHFPVKRVTEVRFLQRTQRNRRNRFQRWSLWQRGRIGRRLGLSGRGIFRMMAKEIHGSK